MKYRIKIITDWQQKSFYVPEVNMGNWFSENWVSISAHNCLTIEEAKAYIDNNPGKSWHITCIPYSPRSVSIPLPERSDTRRFTVPNTRYVNTRDIPMPMPMPMPMPDKDKYG